MIDSSQGDIQTPLLSFQSNLVSFLHLSYSTTADQRVLADVFERSDLAKMDLDQDISDLEMKCLVRASVDYPMQFSVVSNTACLSSLSSSIALSTDIELFPLEKQILREQAARPPQQQFPMGTASSTVADILSVFFDISLGQSASPLLVQPLLLKFYELHSLSIFLFARIWKESSAVIDDYERIVDLFAGHVQSSLSSGQEWSQVKQSVAFP